MDTPVNKKKLSLKEKYSYLTRDLAWEPSYQKKEDLFPYATYEGIKVHDRKICEVRCRLTMFAYWKYHAEQERSFYAIIDAFAQNNSHLKSTDARYLPALKSFLQAISPGEYAALKGFARSGREYPGVVPHD